MDVELTKSQLEYINCDAKEFLVEGSAGSGKTIFACYKTIFYALTYPEASIYVYRTTLPSLKKTSWKEIRELLRRLKIPFEENKTDGIITLENDSRIYFGALDDIGKVRSLNADFIYIEQAEQLEQWDFYVELVLRLGRGKATSEGDGYPQIMLVVQPKGDKHWIYEHYHKLSTVGGDTPEELEHNLKKARRERVIAHFDYRDNYMLPESSRKYYDDLKYIDEELWRRYALGEWGKLTNTIYPNFDTKEFRNVPDFITAGVDFGFNNPSCFLLCAWYDNECYVIDEVYESNLLNRDFITKCDELLFKYNLTPSRLHSVYCDSANPDKIAEFVERGYYAEGGVKDVLGKIYTTKQTRLHIDPKCINTLKEIDEYVWKTDKNGVVLDEPVKVNDHAMDALGYCVYGVRGNLSPNRITHTSTYDMVITI